MELQYNWFTGRTRGFQIENLRVQLLAYRLLTAFLASPKLSSLCDIGEYSLDSLKQEFEQSEIEHLLLQIAILVRVADDNARNEQTLQNTYNPIIGKLYPNKNKRKNNELTLRESCNKIIHARKINYEIIKKNRIWQSYLKPTIYLYGEKNNQKWKAILDIKKFCWAVSGIPE